MPEDYMVQDLKENISISLKKSVVENLDSHVAKLKIKAPHMNRSMLIEMLVTAKLTELQADKG